MAWVSLCGTELRLQYHIEFCFPLWPSKTRFEWWHLKVFAEMSILHTPRTSDRTNKLHCALFAIAICEEAYTVFLLEYEEQILNYRRVFSCDKAGSPSWLSDNFPNKESSFGLDLQSHGDHVRIVTRPSEDNSHLVFDSGSVLIRPCWSRQYSNRILTAQ